MPAGRYLRSAAHKQAATLAAALEAGAADEAEELAARRGLGAAAHGVTPQRAAAVREGSGTASAGAAAVTSAPRAAHTDWTHRHAALDASAAVLIFRALGLQSPDLAT